MTTPNHIDLTGIELHIPGYHQPGNPGAVGAGKMWTDTTGGTGNWVIKIRNATDTGWENTSQTSANQSLTIASGVVTITTNGWYELTSQSGTTDDLDTISGGSAGQIIILSALATHTITLTDTTGNIELPYDVDYALTGSNYIALFFNGTDWRELSRTQESSPPYVHIHDTKSSGTDGGTFTSGAWQTRILTTEVSDAGGVASLGSNQITLAAGTYRARIRCPGYKVAGHLARLYNITDTAVTLGGSSAHSAAADAVQTDAWIVGEFTLAASKVLEVQHYCNTTGTDTGFGLATSIDAEIYTQAEFWKVA